MHITTSRKTWMAPVAASALTAAVTGAALPAVTHAAVDMAALPHVTITARTWTIAAPARLPAGLVRVTLNSPPNAQAGMAMIGRLKTGVSKAAVAAALKTGDPAKIMASVSLLGGPMGSGSADAVVTLSPATYVAFNIGQDAKGKPHSDYGFFSVGAAASPQAGEPSSAATVHELDYKFRLPQTLPSGRVWLKVVNAGPSMHEFVVGRIHAGKTYQDVLSYIKQANPAGPPPVDIVGGAAAMDAKQTQWVAATLTSGNYVAVCFMPDKHGNPHVADGMIKQFTVR